jgi:uncharacterized protein
MTVDRKYQRLIWLYGREILESERMQETRNYIQHGTVSVYNHSLAVTMRALALADFFHIRINQAALIRGALLHDYFLYDWHVKDKSHKWHGFTHARRALENARRDFSLSEIEQDMIQSHMFPLNLKVPKYRESVLLCLADKISACAEMMERPE